jgi:hypothetical protein
LSITKRPALAPAFFIAWQIYCVAKRFRAKHALGLDPWVGPVSRWENASKQRSQNASRVPSAAIPARRNGLPQQTVDGLHATLEIGSRSSYVPYTNPWRPLPGSSRLRARAHFVRLKVRV